MSQHEGEGMSKNDFVQLKNNKENDQEEDKYSDEDVCSFQDEDLDGGELEFVTIIKIGNKQSEVEIKQFPGR